MSWAAAEFAGLDLGDERLNRRAVKLAETFSRQLMASIPSACGGWAEAKAAYRFFGSDSVDWQDIPQPHWQSSRLRMAAPPVVLCLQDTTELDVNGQGIAGLGRQSDAAQRGIYLHLTCAVTPDREPLGVSDAWMWARAEKGVPAPLESARWTEGHERIAEQAGHPPQTRLVYVAEREGAILGLVQRAQALNHPADWLIRSQHDRTLPGGGKLWDTVIAGGPLGTIRFTQPARPGHPARAVRRAVYACRIELAGGVDVTGVVAWELSAPGGVKPIEWRWLSHRACIDFEFAVQLIDWYRVRWDNEWLFHLIKIACRIEALQLSTMERLKRAIALYPVVAWRIARLMRLGRTCPDLPAELFFAPEGWKAAHVLLKENIQAATHAQSADPADCHARRLPRAQERRRTGGGQDTLARITARRRLRHRAAVCQRVGSNLSCR